MDSKTAELVDEPTALSAGNNQDDHFKHSFETQTAPVEHPERNDYYLPKVYDFRKHNFEIIIQPVDTPFWRFGFRYSQSQNFPPNTEARHINKNIADIHLCVGDMRSNRRWHNEKKVYLQSYHVPHKPNPRIIAEKYKGEEITFTTKWNPKTSLLDYELVSNGRILYQNGFKMDGFNSCIFGGWADFNTYKLAADIKVISK
jgi:hypothetical protein